MSIYITDELQNNHKESNFFDTPLYTPEIVAHKLAVSPRSVRKWLRESKLRGIKIGRLWRIKPNDLAEFLEPQICQGHEGLLKDAPFDVSPMSEAHKKALEEAENAIRHGRVSLVSGDPSEFE